MECYNWQWTNVIPLLQTKTADTAHTGIFASNTRPLSRFLGGAWGRGYIEPSQRFQLPGYRYYSLLTSATRNAYLSPLHVGVPRPRSSFCDCWGSSYSHAWCSILGDPVLHHALSVGTGQPVCHPGGAHHCAPRQQTYTKDTQGNPRG